MLRVILQAPRSGQAWRLVGLGQEPDLWPEGPGSPFRNSPPSCLLQVPPILPDVAALQNPLATRFYGQQRLCVLEVGKTWALSNSTGAEGPGLLESVCELARELAKI